VATPHATRDNGVVFKQSERVWAAAYALVHRFSSRLKIKCSSIELLAASTLSPLYNGSVHPVLKLRTTKSHCYSAASASPSPVCSSASSIQMLASWFVLISKIPHHVLKRRRKELFYVLAWVSRLLIPFFTSSLYLGEKLKARWLYICACGISMQNTGRTTKMLTDLISDLITVYAITNPKAYVDLFRTLRKKFFFLRGQNKVINWFI
jgi:hypothetical protein